jgi:uncharacterized membrane protein YsdA (DUF1294 family)
MSYETVFNIANGAAGLAWLYLIFLPRWKLGEAALLLALIPALSLAYSALVFVHFFTVQGGGFSSIAEVRQLFLNDPVLVAGWIHYLAFDLFVGWWIAREADREGISRVIQAPLLVATFLFGPLGLLLFQIIKAGKTSFSPISAKALS